MNIKYWLTFGGDSHVTHWTGRRGGGSHYEKR